MPTSGSIQIIRYANRLEIRNPGCSLKAEERLGQPGSQTRNPKIAAVFHDIKFAETKGSGIRVMRELMDECNLSPPVLQSDRTGNSFLAVLLFHHFLSAEDHAWLATFRDCNLSDDEGKALVSAREVRAIDNRSYRDVNKGIDTLTASKHLKRLCDLGLLQKKGQSTATYYVPTAKLLGPWNDIQERAAERQQSAGPSTDVQAPVKAHDEAPVKAHDEAHDEANETEIRVLKALQPGALSTPELLARLGLKAVSGGLKKALERLSDAGLVEFTIPERPRSKNQKRRLTTKGRRMAASLPDRPPPA